MPVGVKRGTASAHINFAWREASNESGLVAGGAQCTAIEHDAARRRASNSRACCTSRELPRRQHSGVACRSEQFDNPRACRGIAHHGRRTLNRRTACDSQVPAALACDGQITCDVPARAALDARNSARTGRCAYHGLSARRRGRAGVQRQVARRAGPGDGSAANCRQCA